MNWKPVVAGVNGSAASVRAAAAAAMVAQRAGTSCVLITAVPDYQRILRSQGLVVDMSGLAAEAEARDRQAVADSLRGSVPDEMVEALEVQRGNPAVALKHAAMRLGAGLIVIGSRQQRGLDRARSRIARYLVRAAGIPVLVTDGAVPDIHRVFAALDLSYASARTLDAARQWAGRFDARLRVVHVHQPLPPLAGPGGPFVPPDEMLEERLRDSAVWTGITAPEERTLCFGPPARTIREEARRWRADLLVVGSHGSGWADRLLIGSTAEHLIDHPELMTLVVPSGRPAADEPLDIGALPWEVPVEQGAEPVERT